MEPQTNIVPISKKIKLDFIGSNMQQVEEKLQLLKFG